MITWLDYLIHASVVQTGLFINNEFVAGADTIETVNPSTGKVIANVQAGKSD